MESRRNGPQLSSRHDDMMMIHMRTNVIQTNKRRTHAQSNYTNTKLKAWFRRLLSGHETEWAYSTLPGPT